MISDQTISSQVIRDLISPVASHAEPVSYLEQEYFAWKSLFYTQPDPVQHFIEAQAQVIAEALSDINPRFVFSSLGTWCWK